MKAVKDQNGDVQYSRREFDHYFQDMRSNIQETMTTVKEIKVQTTLTNGRVSKLEWWRSTVLWALGALWTILLLLGPWLIHKISEDAIQQALTTYD